jgi:Holliday junction resolvase RusA-like endonuclease
MYDPPKSREYKDKIKGIIAGLVNEPLECPLEVSIVAHVGIPKSKPKKFRGDALRGAVKPTKKPDVDNMAKIVLDGCNGILYKDDCQVVDLRIVKIYSDNPRVEVEIKEVS